MDTVGKQMRTLSRERTILKNPMEILELENIISVLGYGKEKGL